MNIITTEPTTDEPKVSETVNDILAGYKEAKIEEPIPQEHTSESIVQNLGEFNDVKPENTDNWQGDNRYYQTGKKAGQLRPKPRISAKYNHDATQSIPASQLVNGALFLAFINFIIPLAISGIHNWLNKKNKLAIKDLKLTNDEKKEIDPLMDATLKQLNINANPLILLIISLVGAYSVKYFNVTMMFPEPEIIKKNEAKTI